MDGFLLVDKPIGMTSHDVVQIAKRTLKVDKIGHTGTLDPFASGLLILCIGKATRLAHLFQNSDKAYEGTIELGALYDTYDTTGKIIDTKEINVTEEILNETIKKFHGTYMQEPPMYSAIKVDGKKLYELARAGKEIERALREVTIFDLKLTKPFVDKQIHFYAHVSKGTYIRSLALDMAKEMDTLGSLSALRRVSIGTYDVKKAHKLENIKPEHIVDMKDYLAKYPKLVLKPFFVHLAKNGVHLDERQIVTNEPFVVYNEEGQMIAYYEVYGENKYKPVLIF